MLNLFAQPKWILGLLTLGMLWPALGIVEAATPPLSQSLETPETPAQTTADQLLAQGLQQFNRGDFQQALTTWQQALAHYRDLIAVGPTPTLQRQEGRTLGYLGEVYRQLGDYQQATELHQQQLALARVLGDPYGEGRALGDLGNVYFSLGQYFEAIATHEQALAVVRIAREESGSIALQGLEGRILGDLGNPYLNQGRYPEAIAAYEQALAIAERLDDPIETGNALGNLGETYLRLGQYDQAVAFQQRSLALAQSIGDRLGEGNALRDLGNAYVALGDYEAAITTYQAALSIAQDVGNPVGISHALGNLGVAHAGLGDEAEAIAFYGQALAIRQRIGDRLGQSIALSNLGSSYFRLGDYEQAMVQYQQALPIARELGARANEGLILSNIGKLFYRQDQPELAIVFLKASIQVREAIRAELQGLERSVQQSFTDTVADTYRFLAELLLQQDRIIEAQQILDLLKLQELEDYLQTVQRSHNSAGQVAYLRPEADILAQYNALQQSAVTLGQDLEALKTIPQGDRTEAQNQRIAELTDLLASINGDFREFVRSPDIEILIDQLSREAQDASLRLGELNRLRDELDQLNAAIIYPLVLEDRLELVITTPDAPPLRRTVPIGREQLNQAILDFRRVLGGRDPSIVRPARQLYSWLIAPLENDLAAAGVETLIYSPDGQLRYIPLAALHDGEQWLVERYRIQNITAAAITDLTVPPSGELDILAAAYADASLVHSPEINGQTYTFTGLPGAGVEVTRLPTQSQFLDQAFSLDALLPIMDEYTVLHLATHAVFVAGAPEDSFILFGNGDTPTLRDIENWTLNGVDLVVLSACETGLGGLGNGEEVLGLGYQFQVNGARSVIASLWAVNDVSTSLLMQRFYALMTTGNFTKTEALRQAQLSLLDGEAFDGFAASRGLGVQATAGAERTSNGFYQHPYYWAPFILIGNGL